MMNSLRFYLSLKIAAIPQIVCEVCTDLTQTLAYAVTSGKKIFKINQSTNQSISWTNDKIIEMDDITDKILVSIINIDSL